MEISEPEAARLAVDAVPTLKGGSTIGIPSPPAIRLPYGEGIAPSWTFEMQNVSRASAR